MKFELIEAGECDLSGERQANRSFASRTRCFVVGATAATVATVAIAAVAAGAGAYAASEQAGAEEDANNTNIANAKDTNAQNKQLFDESRGSKGNALYPIYARTNGKPFEPQLFSDTMGTYNAVNALPPSIRLDNLNNALAPLNEAQNAATRTVAGVYDGSLEKEAIANQQPVNQGRQAVANSALTALAQTLNDIKAINARKGYSGDSFGTRLLQFNARRGAGEEMASANLANAIDERQIHNQALLARIQNVGLPYAESQQAVNQSTLAENSVLDQQARRQQIFNNFRIGPGQFAYQRLPDVKPVASTGQIVAQGISSAATTANTLRAQNSAAQGYQTTPNYGSFGNPNGRSDFQQSQFEAAQRYYGY